MIMRWSERSRSAHPLKMNRQRHHRSPSSIRSLSVVLAVGVVLVSVSACSSDDEASKDPGAACKDVCSSAGFTSSRVDAQPHETNCFCTGGTGTVTPAACTEMCSALGKGKSEPFGAGPQGANACQCS